MNQCQYTIGDSPCWRENILAIIYLKQSIESSCITLEGEALYGNEKPAKNW